MILISVLQFFLIFQKIPAISLVKQKFSGEFHSSESHVFSTEPSRFCTLFAGRFTPAPRCPLISVKGHKTLSSNAGRARCGSQKLAPIQVQWKMSSLYQTIASTGCKLNFYC